MSKYTTELRYICEAYAGLDHSVGYDQVNSVIEASKDQIFEEYEIFDEAYRSVLNTKILRHYYTREICAETVGLWKLWLNNTMHEIMPYYNQLYRSATLEFNPFYDVDYSVSHVGTGSSVNKNKVEEATTHEDNRNTSRNTSENIDTSGNRNNVDSSSSKGTTNASDKDRGTNSTDTTNRMSDTPQGGLNGMESLELNTYLSAASIANERNVHENTSDRTSSNTTDTSSVKSETSNEDRNRTENGFETAIQNGKVNKNGESSNELSSLSQYTERVSGKRSGASYAYMLMEYRKTMLNIDEMIINELSDLFFKLY